MVIGSSCWLICVLGGLGGLLVIYVGSWWFLEVLHGFLVIVDGSWWFLIILGGFWWFLEVFWGAFVLLVFIGDSWLF